MGPWREDQQEWEGEKMVSRVGIWVYAVEGEEARTGNRRQRMCCCHGTWLVGGGHQAITWDRDGLVS